MKSVNAESKSESSVDMKSVNASYRLITQLIYLGTLMQPTVNESNFAPPALSLLLNEG